MAIMIECPGMVIKCPGMVIKCPGPGVKGKTEKRLRGRTSPFKALTWYIGFFYFN